MVYLKERSEGNSVPKPVLLDPKTIVGETNDQIDRMRAQAMENAQQASAEAEKHFALGKAFKESASQWFDMAGANPGVQEGEY